MAKEKPVDFRGSSLDDLRKFPPDAKSESGFQIDLVQKGLEADDWKPMPSIGPGVQEIRIWDSTGTYRVIHVAKFPEAVYILHCFKKTTEKTEQKDIDLATDRYKGVLAERKNHGK